MSITLTTYGRTATESDKMVAKRKSVAASICFIAAIVVVKAADVPLFESVLDTSVDPFKSGYASAVFLWSLAYFGHLAIDGFIVLGSDTVECSRDAAPSTPSESLNLLMNYHLGRDLRDQNFSPEWPEPSWIDYLITRSASPMLSFTFSLVILVAAVALFAGAVALVNHWAGLGLFESA